MSRPNNLSLEAIREFMLMKGGKVTNHELVKHFKDVLTDPNTRDEARVRFKELVNTLATITREPDGGKQLVLKKRYRQPLSNEIGLPIVGPSTPVPSSPSPSLSLSPLDTLPLNLNYQPVYHTSHDSLENLGSPLRSPYRSISQDSSYSSPFLKSPLSPQHFQPSRATPSSSSTRPASVASSSSSSSSHHLRRNYSQDSIFADQRHALSPPPPPPPPPPGKSVEPPPVPPRRKSSDKLMSLPRMETKENEGDIGGVADQPISAEAVKQEDNKENAFVEDSKISVKERMQKFDRMASESALNKASLPSNKKRLEKVDRDEEDSASVTLLDAKSREWLVRCAQGNYQALVKMAAENPKLVKFKDPSSYTALHWGAKHGNEDIIKLIAGTHGANVNVRTNGGYTALHLAMQFGHDECYHLLVDVYGADSNLRDWSGKKPRQYRANKGTSVSADTSRKIKARKKHAAEKDLGFLRIGSLNVRVKRTTEAFSNFLGVGNAEKIHKNWGSADNLPQGDSKRMPPPKFAPIKKRKSKRAHDYQQHNHRGGGGAGAGVVGPLIEKQRSLDSGVSSTSNIGGGQDSDSDSAAGFGSSWQSTV